MSRPGVNFSQVSPLGVARTENPKRPALSHAEIIAIEGDSYRRREAEERKKKRREGRK